jgi:cytochrome P450
VPEGARVGLCWSSANFDEAAFPDAFAVKLDRKPNPHLAFGFGTHLCLGAPHARLILRSLLRLLCEKVGQIRIEEKMLRSEKEAVFTRVLGYETLRVKFERLG